MNRDQVFPTILIVFDVAAALGYAMEYDLRRTIYWIAAAVITACVTY